MLLASMCGIFVLTEGLLIMSKVITTKNPNDTKRNTARPCGQRGRCPSRNAPAGLAAGDPSVHPQGEQERESSCYFGPPREQRSLYLCHLKNLWITILCGRSGNVNSGPLCVLCSERMSVSMFIRAFLKAPAFSFFDFRILRKIL
jgi:hypothetical protein